MGDITLNFCGKCGTRLNAVTRTTKKARDNKNQLYTTVLMVVR